MLADLSLSFCRILGSIVLFNATTSLRVTVRITFPLCFTDEAFFEKERTLDSIDDITYPFQKTLKLGIVTFEPIPCAFYYNIET
jgi:hypothetical protein